MTTGYVSAFPAITQNEFEAACLHLLHTSTPLLAGSAWTSIEFINGELRIEQLTRAIPPQQNVQSTLADDSDELIDDHDQEFLNRFATVSDQSATTSLFSIVLSPVYEVPVLWFKPFADRPARVTDLDHIYAHMVIPQLRRAMQHVGVMGAISIAHHPKSDLPMFFIHPCETQEAMRSVSTGSSLTTVQYLALWFGIIGAAVGLAIPNQVADKLSRVAVL